MTDEILKRDQNFVTVLGGVTDDVNQSITMLRVNPTTKRLLVSATGSGSGSVTSISQGTGILLTPSPITTTGSVALSTALQPIATLAGNSLKVLRVNVGETAVEYATPSTSLTVGSTTIASGTTTRILYDNAGTLGEYTISGSGTAVAMATSPVLTTPNIGVATATSVNGLTITSSTGVLTITNAKTLAVTNTITLSGTDSTVMTFPSTSATIARTDAANTFIGIQTITNLTLPTNGQILLTVPTTDGHCTGPTTNAFVSGYTSSAVGDLVYLDSNSKWQKADADAASTASNLLGIALAVAATDASLLVALPGSFVYATAFPTLAIGSPYYVGETAGAIQATIPTGADNVIRVVGFAVHADKLYFYPSQDNQTTVA